MSNNKTPALFAWIASVATLGVIVATQYLPRGNHPVLRVTGVAVLLLATVFVFWPFHLLAKHGAIGRKQPYTQTTTVVDRGLYAIIRHPQYLGYALLACGFALLSQHWVSCLLAAIGVTCFYVQAVHEERACLARLGRPYAQYCQRVPRFNAILGLARLVLGGSGGSE
jgi:protein-S-isoprenylcysteine O-methyltransferase Ste14